MKPEHKKLEQMFLADLIQDNDQFAIIAPLILESDFSIPAHGVIFRAIADLATCYHPYDVVTVAEWLEQHLLLNEIGGLPVIGGLNVVVPLGVDIRSSALHIRDAARKRNKQDDDSS